MQAPVEPDPAAMAERYGAELSFPNWHQAGHYTGLQKDWERVRLRAGLAEVRVHDLRHSFASFAVADGKAGST